MAEYRVPINRGRFGSGTDFNNTNLERWLNDRVVRFNDDGDVDLGGGKVLRASAYEMLWYSANPSVSDGPDKYPEGMSYSNLSSATGWPTATGWVETFIDTSTQRAHQIVRGKTRGYAFERYWASATTWSSWGLVDVYQDQLGTTTAYANVAINTWETWRTEILTSLPSSSFSARINVTAQAREVDTLARTSRMRVQISRDGGSTWSTGRQSIASNSAGYYSCIVAMGESAGSVTGDIHVRVQVYSGVITSYDDLTTNIVITGY